MKKLNYIIVFVLLISISAFSQLPKLYYENGNLKFEKKSVAYLFGNNVRLREHPNKTSKEIEKLPILQKIILIERTEFKEIIDGVESNWIKIKTKNNIGYILDYFISASYTKDNEISYISRINYENEKKHLEFRKVYKGNNGSYNAEKIKIEIPHSDISIETIENKGLQGISKLIFIKYWAEACGVTGGGEYIFLHRGKIIDRFKLNEISDAGAFWKTEKLVFPNENQNLEKNTIQFIQEIGNVVDETSQWYEKKIVERQHRLIEGKFYPTFKSKVE